MNNSVTDNSEPAQLKTMFLTHSVLYEQSPVDKMGKALK